MALFPPVQSFRPTSPDFHVCDPIYANDAHIQNCLLAISKLPQGSAQQQFSTGDSTAVRGNYVLPLIESFADCYITVEAAGPNLPPMIEVVPNDIRTMAGWVISQCVIRASAQGGFVTQGFTRVLGYILQPLTILIDPYPNWTAFLTVTVSNRSTLFTPGNFDPAVPREFSDYQTEQASSATRGSPLHSLYQNNVELWTFTARGMQRGGSEHWWYQLPLSLDDMGFRCDISLGQPSQLDCNDIGWGQLRIRSDAVDVEPAAPIFLHSNTCYLAISSTVATTITWTQIQAAISMLMSICLSNPCQLPRGGHAYYSAPAPAVSQLQAQKCKRSQNAKVPGLGALPPYVNITLFEQREAWIDAATEVNSCAWKAITSAKSVLVCGNT